MTELHVDPDGHTAPGYPIPVQGETPPTKDPTFAQWAFCAVGKNFVVVWDNIGDAYVVALTPPVDNLRADTGKPKGVHFW